MQTNGEADSKGNPTGGKNIPGTITIKNPTIDSGTNGKDVKIQFGSIGEDGKTDVAKFTVDAGSKVEGLKDEATAKDGDTLTGLKINGVEYDLSQGKTYSPGQGIAISDDNKISVDKGDGLEFTSNADDAKLEVNANEDKGIIVNSSGVAVNAGEGLAFETQEENKGQLKVNAGDGLTFGTDQTGDAGQLKVNVGDGLSIDSDSGKLVNNLKVIEATKKENDPNKAHSDGGNWKIEDSAHSDIEFKNTTLSSSVTSKPESEVNNGETEESGKRVVYGKDYVISDTDGNTATLSDVASAKTLQNVDKRLITTEGNVETINGTLAGAVMYDKVGNSYDKSLVTLGGTTYDKDDEDTGTRLTNVAYADVNGENTGSDAVNVDLLKDYVDENGGGSWKLTTSQDDNKTTVGKGNTVDFAGATKDEGSAAHQNIHVTQETQYDDEGNVTGTNVKFDLDNKLVLGDNDQITIDGSKGSANIGGVNITTTTTNGNTSSTIDGLTNNTWNDGNTEQYNDSKKAATEGQLYDALTGLSKEADVAVVHANNSGNKDATGNNLKDTKAVIWNEAGNDERSSSIALGKDAFVSVQNGYKSQGILFGSDTYTGGIAIGQEATALNGTVNIGVKDYKGQMGDVTISSNRNPDKGSNEAYNTYPASGTGETSIGSNSYISGMLSTNTGSYNIVSTKYMNTDPERILGRDVSSLYALQNTGAVVMGTLNSIESNTSKDNAISIATNIVFSGNDDSVSAKISGVANNVVGMANKTNNTNGSLIFGTGNEITNSLDDIPLPDSVIESIKNEILSNHGGTITQENASEIAEEFRKAVADRKNQNGGAVLAIGGGNKADNVLNSQLIGVQNQITGKEGNESEYNMVNGYQNTVENGSNDTVIGVNNNVTGNDNIVLGNNRNVGKLSTEDTTSTPANNNVIIGSYDGTTKSNGNHMASDTVIIGHNAQVSGNKGVAIGSGAQALTDNSVAVGSNAQVSANNSVAIGNGSVAEADKIGGISTTEGIEAPNYAGLDPVGTVSVGSAGSERTITNVAAGRIDATSTDAVNGSQLYDVQQEAGKHTTIQETGKNVTVKTNGTTDGHLDYTVDLNDDVTLDGNIEDSNKINLSGTEGTIDVVKANGSTNINGGIITVSSGTGEGSKAIKIDGTTAEITGLSNTTLGDGREDSTFAKVGRAATEEQLQAAMTKIDEGSYKGWNVTTNKGTKTAEVASDGNVDFSNTDGNIIVGQDGTNLTFDLNDNITLGDAKGQHIQFNGSPASEENGMVSITDESGNEVFNIQQDGTLSSDGDIIADADGDGGKYSLSEVSQFAVRYDTLAKDKITLDGTNGTTITNVAAGVNDMDAVNVSQLKDVEALAGKHTIITVNGGTAAPTIAEGETESTYTGGNLQLKQKNNDGRTEYDVKLNDDIYLGGDQTADSNNIALNGSTGTISATVENGMSSDTLTFDGDGLTVSKDTLGYSDGSTNISGDTITTTDEYNNSTTIDGGSVTTENLTVNAENDNRLTFNRNGLNVNSSDTNFNVGKDGISLSVDNGEGNNSSLKVTQDGTEFSYSKNGVSDATTTTIKGNTVTISSDAKDIVIDGNTGTITGLSNTDLNDPTFATMGRAATEEQLQKASAASKTTISDGKNTNVTWEDKEDGHRDYKVNLNDNVTLGEGSSQITLNGKPEGDAALMSVGDKLVVEQDGTTTITADDAETMGTDTKVTVGTNGVAFEGLGNGTTFIDGQTIHAGGIDINGEETKGTITKLTNTDWDPNGTYTMGRAATEEQLQKASAASKTTISDGKNTNVTWEDKEDGHRDYKVNLNDNVYLGGNRTAQNSNIKLDGEKGNIQVGSNIALLGEDGRAIIGGVDISTTFDDIGKKSATITGLSNTTWDADKVVIDRAATEGQLQMVSDKVTAGWTATDDNGNKINVNPDNHPTLNFASGKNITVSAVNDEVEVSLNDNINLNNRVYINGDPEEGNNTIVDIKSSDTSKEESIFAVEDKGNGSISIGGIDITNVDGPYLAVGDGKLKFYKDGGLSTGNATGTFSVRPDGDLEINGKNSSFNVDAETGNVNAINNSGSAIMMNDDSVALNASGNGVAISDEGITLNTNGSAVTVDRFNGATFTNTNTTESTNINGANITAGEGENQIKINGAPKADDPALSVGTDKFVVGQDGSLSVSDKFNVDAETGNINAVNSNGSAIMMNDDSVALNASGNGVAISNEGITLNANGSAVTVDRFNGATFTNTNTGETTNINGDIITTDTVKGLSNTTWDDELATQVANSEELQGTAATQGQLQQAVSAVATEAAKQHTTVSGDDNLTVKSSVNENGGTNYQVTLDDDITLGNPKAGNTEGERSFTINTTAPEGYVPDSYKEENSSGAEFIKENGGFMLFATDTQGHGIFGVTAKGSAWAKDFKTYTTDIYGNNTQYSLNDVGDAVAQMSSYYNKENGKSYTVFSRYLNEAEKDNPFATVDENATRDIPLALRDDGAVLIGATIKGDDFTDNGIRINAETETTYDGDGNEVTNNIATITGLENTEWKPPTPVATFAANDINTTSRAATEAQLDDLYSAVAAYDVNVDGTIDYSHIALAGAPYGASRAGNGTPTGGTSITNVAYASGNDGSEAVNVDYLNDAISDAVEKGGVVSETEKHLATNSGTKPDGNATYAPDADGNITISEVNGDGTATGNSVVISDVASKEDLDNLKDDVGDLDYSKVEGDTIIDGDSVTDAIGKLDNKIENISGTATDADNNTVTGGKINSDGTISLTQKDKDSIKLEGQLTDSGVVQEGTSFDKETGTITITSQDKYSGETSSVKVEGIASTEVVGATNKEDLATAYKDADKDGNATTEYITDSESMVEADVALDHAIQDVANTSYANDMVLSNRIDSVEKRLGNVEERIDKVGAMAAAIANLRTMGFDPEAPTEIAIGVGQYKSETGIAIGVFHYPNQDFMLSASLSSSGDELMGGIGATWKLGRKSAAERAKDEEARHLEQAEEMKKLAQQEKVKAQAQRHAKLLAERQQASQKNA